MSLILDLKTVIKSLWIVKGGNNVQFRVVGVHEAVKKDNSVHVSFNLTICCRWLSLNVCLCPCHIYSSFVCVAVCILRQAVGHLLIIICLAQIWVRATEGGIQTRDLSLLHTHNYPPAISNICFPIVPKACPPVLPTYIALSLSFVCTVVLAALFTLALVFCSVRLRQSNDHFGLIRFFDLLSSQR